MAALVSGCAALKLERTDPPAPSLGPRKIAGFFDGTSNHVADGTNTSELFVLARGQGDVGTFYIEGVGAKGKPIGLAMAWGIGERVRLAYAYLAEHYRPGDDIYIFGFSRGAYSGRILASMLYHAGLLSGITAEELSDLVFDAYNCPMLESDKVCSNPGEWGSAKRIEKVTTALSRYQLPRVVPVPVRFTGLWDTVEALGWPDYKEDVDVPNPRYADQLCNVRAAHASCMARYQRLSGSLMASKTVPPATAALVRQPLLELDSVHRHGAFPGGVCPSSVVSGSQREPAELHR